MQKYIDAIPLYEHAVALEAKALDVVQKLNARHFAQMGADDITAWKVWSCILNERTAFKHDIMDAPTVDAVERKVAVWIKNEVDGGWHCSCCGKTNVYAFLYDGEDHLVLQDLYCPKCGAIMQVEENGI